MKLNRTGRKFAVFYVAVTLTIFVGLELDRIPLTFVHVLATKVFVMLALLWWALNHWVFVFDKTVRANSRCRDADQNAF